MKPPLSPSEFRPRSPSQRDDKDFAEHLRTVQFALAVIGLALIVLTTAPGSNTAKTAHEQIAQILELQHSWSARWIHEEAKRIMNDRATNNGGGPITFEEKLKAIIVNGKKYNVTFRWPDWFLLAPPSQSSEREDPSWDFGGIADMETPVFYRKTPANLNEFRVVWDSLAHAKLFRATAFEGQALVSDDGLPSPDGPDVPNIYALKVHLVRWERIDPSPTYPTLQFTFTVFSEAARKFIVEDVKAKFPYRCAYIAAPLDWTNKERVALLSSGKAIEDIDLQGALIRNSNGPWRHGKFEDVFRELNSLTAKYQDVPLSATERIVGSELDRSKDSFEQFGIKFPTENAARWGVLLLIATQIYFWLHLAEYRRRQITNVPIAWIGAYKSVQARIVFCVTTLLFPVGVVCFIAAREKLGLFPVWLHWTVTISGILTSLAIAALTAREYFSIRR